MSKFFIGILFGLAQLASANASKPGLWLPAILGDHMVLQQDRELEIWGRSGPYEKMLLKFADIRMKTTADAEGAWSFKLPELNPGGPFDMEIQGAQKVVVHDVLIGEVWLGAGDSNMALAMQAAQDGDVDVPEANFPQIRFFSVEKAESFTRQEDLHGQWKLCTPETVRNFSAVAYHFGKEIYESLNMPVGLIVSAWDDSPVEDWVARGDLDAMPALQPLLKSLDSNLESQVLWDKGQAFGLQVRNLRFIPKNSASSPLEPKGTWSHFEKDDSDATLESDSPEALAYHGGIKGGSAARATLNLGSMDLSRSQAIAFEAQGHGNFQVELGQAGDALAYVSAPFDPKDDWSNEILPLDDFKYDGEDKPGPFLRKRIQKLSFGVNVASTPDLASVIFNGMIAPLQHYGIRGVLWYQGEANAFRPDQYQDLVTALIDSWRRLWNEDALPFLVVQVPNYGRACGTPCESNLAELRDAQRVACGLAGTGLVTAIDLGDASTMNPKDKTELGVRLARNAMVTAYAKPGVPEGPRFDAVKASHGKFILSFKYAQGGLVAKGGELKGFTIAGSQGTFQIASAKIMGETVEVWSSAIASPQKLRYDWADNPDGNLYDSEGLPASPFEASLKGR